MPKPSKVVACAVVELWWPESANYGLCGIRSTDLSVSSLLLRRCSPPPLTCCIRTSIPVKAPPAKPQRQPPSQQPAPSLSLLPAAQPPVKAPPTAAVQLPVKRLPRESANTAGPAVSKSESTATTIDLAVATPVGAHPKAPRRIALNAHAIASLLVHTRGLTFVFPSHEANDICQIVPTVHDAGASR